MQFHDAIVGNEEHDCCNEDQEIGEDILREVEVVKKLKIIFNRVVNVDYREHDQLQESPAPYAYHYYLDIPLCLFRRQMPIIHKIFDLSEKSLCLPCDH